MKDVPRRYNALRGSIRRVLRACAFLAVDIGLLEGMARVVSAVDRRRGLYLKGRVARIAVRHADHTDFWLQAARRFPGDNTFVRSGLDAALRAGRTREAETAAARLLSAGDTGERDTTLIIGLAMSHQAHGDVSSIKNLVRSFLKSLRGRPDYKTAAFKLCRVLSANFRRRPALDIHAERERNRLQFSRMLDRSAARPEPKAILERVVRCEVALEATSALFLPDTDISRLQCEAFVRLIREKLAAGEPFSFVRVGDGEAACLPYEPHLAWLAKGDAREREKIWWGRALSPKQRARTTRRVFHAIWSADCIGIPTASRFLREIHLSRPDRLEHGLTGRGLRSILHAVEHYEAFRSAAIQRPIFTSCHLHQDLERWGLYSDLLAEAAEIVLVSCHPGLAQFAKDRYGARVVRGLVLPPDRVTGPALNVENIDRRLLPDVLDEVVEELADWPRGRLVLVGAGYLGKWLVDVARARGGVALDLGSVFDHWLGFSTRSYLDLLPFVAGRG